MELALTVALDRTSLRPLGGRVHLVVTVVAPDAAPCEPERHAREAWTVLALDVSGSMKGEPLAQVIRSVDFLLDGLRAEDRLGVVAFSDDAETIAAPVAVDADGKRLVRSEVRRLRADGRTNVEAGLARAVELLTGAPREARRGVVLLSDGVPNEGASTAEELRAVVLRHRPGVAFSSLGYGIDHQEDVLSAVGGAGGGGYELVVDPRACARAFAKALGAQADVIASGLELVIAPSERASVVRIVSGEQARVAREGMVVALPDLVPGARGLVVAELELGRQPNGAFLAPVADVTLRWRPARGAASDVRHRHERVTVEVADREPAMVTPAVADVLLVRAERARAEARAMGDREQFAGAAAHLRAVLREIDALPGHARADGSPLAEAYEQLVDEATALERMPAVEQYAAFRKQAVASDVTLGVASAPRSRGPVSSRLLDLATGEVPVAFVEIVEGPGKGTRFRLEAESLIGRTAAAHIALASPTVARRHAELHAEDGAFYVTDLASTGGVEVNGVRLGIAPRRVLDGDRLRVGDVVLRYEERGRV